MKMRAMNRTRIRYAHTSAHAATYVYTHEVRKLTLTQIHCLPRRLVLEQEIDDPKAALVGQIL